MTPLMTFLKYEMLFLIGALFLLVAYGLLTGRINSTGLLSTKDKEEAFSPARVQLLVATLAGAFGYLTQIFNNPGRLPDVPTELILTVGGSNLFFVGTKAHSLLSSIRNAQKHKEGGN